MERRHHFGIDAEQQDCGRSPLDPERLLDAISGNHIWSERYDRELTDIFALQDEITTRITAAIEPKLLEAEGIRAEARSIEHLAPDIALPTQTRDLNCRSFAPAQPN